MKQNKYMASLRALMNEYLNDCADKLYEVVGVENAENNKSVIVIRLHGRYIIKKTAAEVILDDQLVGNLEPIAVRAITYMAVQEKFSPDYQINSLKIGCEVEEYIVTLRNMYSNEEKTANASEINRDKNVISNMTPEEANRIGYLAGIEDTVRDYKINE